MRGEVLVVVGMGREARIVGGGAIVGVAGLAGALERRPAGVISFGLCGGLDPALRVGDLVVGGAVVAGGERFEADWAWTERLLAALPGAVRADVAGGEAMITTPAAKAALRRETGAAAVDMESHAVARAGVPFAILRAVSDPADRALPRAAQVGLKADGEADVGAVLRALIARPGELPALLRIAREAERAFRALRDARDLLGPGIGCPYLGELGLDVA